MNETNGQIEEGPTLDQYCRVPLQPFYNFIDYDTSIRASTTHYGEAERYYNDNYACSLPNSYEVRSSLVANLYDDLTKQFGSIIYAQPITSIPFNHRNPYTLPKNCMGDSVPEPEARDTGIESVLVRAWAVVCDITQSITGVDQYTRLGHCREKGHISKADYMFWYTDASDNSKTWLLPAEFKGITGDPSIIQEISDWVDQRPREVHYEDESTISTELTERAIGKLVVQMVLNKVDVAILSDHNYWVFAHLSKPKNKRAKNLILSKVYPINTNEIPLIGTVAAMLMHAHPHVPFKSKFNQVV